LEAGYEVIGGFMKNWSNCEWRADRRDAMRVAAQLDIPFLTFDFEKEYRDNVIEYLFAEYEAGRTPNPDVMCNKFVKFDLFLREADKLGCDFVATGHYARVARGTPLRSFGASEGQAEGATGTEGTRVLVGVDSNKDQTYFLWAIRPHVIPRILFPVGGMRKPDVRAKARALGLPVADKKDSMGICFVGEVDIQTFLKERIVPCPGEVVTTTGKVVGRHDGLAFYTLGQRAGLSFGGGMPYYLVEKRPATNQLVVSSNYDQALYQKTLSGSQTNWFRSVVSDTRCQARIRYHQPFASCTITKLDTASVRVEFDEPQRAVTPGQSIVFYDGEEMLGGAIID
jgi:tRNA-specific 2-thiouridylase